MFVSESVYIDFAGAMAGEMCMQNCLFLASSFIANIRLPTSFSLCSPIFGNQLTVVGNVTMQLSKGTVLDNYEAVYMNIVN